MAPSNMFGHIAEVSESMVLEKKKKEKRKYYSSTEFQAYFIS